LISGGFSVLLPAYNEAENIVRLMEEAIPLLKQLERPHEVIIIDDGSTDGTLDSAKQLAEEYQGIKVLHERKNRGMGFALRQGITSAQYDFLVYVDADNQIKLDSLRDALAVLQPGEMAAGYRLRRREGFFRRGVSFFYSRAVSFIFGLGVRDVNCGFKCFSRSLVAGVPLCSDGFFFSAELLIRAKRRGIKIREFPVSHYKREYGRSSVSILSLFATLRDIFRLLRQ
jgi:glycosyltransferase involved in cell wall biosynthesis